MVELKNTEKNTNLVLKLKFLKQQTAGYKIAIKDDFQKSRKKYIEEIRFKRNYVLSLINNKKIFI